jgi:short-subunit dehydrogenase
MILFTCGKSSDIMEDTAMVDVCGKWCFITGASRGLGRLCAEYMADHGANLILQSRTLESLGDVAESIADKGIEVCLRACELSDSAQIEAMLKSIDLLNVDVDIVLNNAGLQIAYRNDYFNTPVSDFIESMKINTVAPALTCYHFMPKMIERGFGRIVNTTSGIALEPQQAGYSASKAALNKITVDLGSTVEGTDVMINLTDPGWCRTDLGGQKAPNSPDSAIPGLLVGAFADDRKSGRIFEAQRYKGMTISQAVAMAQS